MVKKPRLTRVEEEASLGHLVSTLPLENDKYELQLRKRRLAKQRRRANKKKKQ